MKISTMRKIDLWLGAPACWLLGTLTSQFSAVNPQMPGPDFAGAILIIHLSEMGAMVLAQPAIDTLKRACPNAKIYFLSFPLTRELLLTLNTAPADRCLCIRTDNFGIFAKDTLKAVHILREVKPAAVLDFEGFSRFSALISGIVCPGGIKAGFYPDQIPHLYRGRIHTHKVQYNPHQHASQSYMMLIKSLWASPEDRPFPQIVCPESAVPYSPLPFDFHYSPSADDNAYIAAEFQRRGIPNDACVIIANPNSSDMLPLRRWPLQRYAEVLQVLSAKIPNMHIAVTGTASESIGARKLKSALPDINIHDFSGSTTISQLLALYTRSRLMITNDSGPVHLASIVGLPCVAVYGPETPLLFSPLGDRTRVMYAGMCCSPCVSPYNGKNSLCRTAACLKAITSDSVCRAALEQLEKYS